MRSVCQFRGVSAPTLRTWSHQRDNTKRATGWRGVRWPEPVDAKLAPAHGWFVAMPGQTFRKPIVVLNDISFWLNSTLDWRPKWMETCKKCYGQKRKKRGTKKKKRRGETRDFAASSGQEDAGKMSPTAWLGGGGLPNDDKGCLTTLELLVSPLAPLPNAVFRTLLGASQSLQEMLGISRP